MKAGWLALTATLLSGALPAPAQSPDAGGPRHVVLIMADDLGIEGLGCYGGRDYRTPNLDRLAGGGLRFTHAYSQPLCTPTRVEIMTGRENHRNWRCFGILPPGEKTFGHLMQGLGFRTCIAGKWQLQSYDPPGFPGADRRRGTGMHPADAGFHDYQLFHALHTEDKGSRYANPTFFRNGELVGPVEGAYGEDLSVAFIARFLEENRDGRMFVYYPMALPHWPVQPTPASAVWDEDPTRRLEEDPDYFPDMVEYMDEVVGDLLGHLDRLGLRDDTLVLFYSDNGTDAKVTSRFGDEVVRGGKATPHQSGIRVPLIASWPGRIAPGVTADLVDPSDFVPTLAELAGGGLPDGWATDGVSFAPHLLGRPATPREWAFFWYDPRPGWDKERFSRSVFALDHRYKLYSDGRMADIAGVGVREVPLDPGGLSEEAVLARSKLQGVIDRMMRPPMSAAAQAEVDAFGDPVGDAE